MIGVCIKYFHHNYGGMLQAYATTVMMDKLGVSYELIRYRKKSDAFTVIRSLPRLFNAVLLNDKYEMFLKKLGMKMHPDVALREKQRAQCFEHFSEQHFTNLSSVYHGYEQLCRGALRYSAVLTGSDQLWSPAGLPTNYYNLMFVPETVRRISYASSFGVNEIPWYQEKRTAAFLKRLDYISMRENRGTEIVKELIGNPVPTVLDPVFMLDQKEWENRIPVQREIQEPYIFAYFLGRNPQHRAAVKKAAKELGCKIVTLPHIDQYVPADDNFGDIALYDVGPAEFLNLLRGATYVCTDSYHGGCFSVIHRKQFVIFDRYSERVKYSKNSRIDTLCNNLGVTERRFQEERSLAEQLQTAIDYDAVMHCLAEQRKNADAYLKNAFACVR